MKRSCVLLSCVVALTAVVKSSPAHADREIGLGINYDPRVPIGDFRALVPDVALVGVQAKWEYYAIARRLALGFDVQYHYFQQGDEVTTVPIANGAATAPFTRYAFFLAVLPTVRYFPL